MESVLCVRLEACRLRGVLGLGAAETPEKEARGDTTKTCCLSPAAAAVAAAAAAVCVTAAAQAAVSRPTPQPVNSMRS